MAIIEPFWGELGHVPVPLEVSHNWCSHACHFCFANLNKPNRKADVEGIFRQLRNYKKHTSFASVALQKKLAVAVSNKTDPFARSNYKITLPMLELMAQDGIPVFMQTRGGVGVDEALEILPRTLWYVSITHTDDTTRKLVEPGAPSIESRWELVDKLHAKGHEVLVAVNPYAKQWVDNEVMLKRLEAHKPAGVVLQLLHLNTRQIANMSERAIDNMGADVMKYSRKRNPDEEQLEAMEALHDGAMSLGLHVKNYNQPSKINIAGKVYRDVYGSAVFNDRQGFIEWCRANKQPFDLVTFKEYETYFFENFPFDPRERFPIKSYLTSQSKAMREGVKIPSQLSFRDVLRTQWNMEEARSLLVSGACFAILAEGEGEEMALPRDAEGNIAYVWHPEGFVADFVGFSNQTGAI